MKLMKLTGIKGDEVLVDPNTVISVRRFVVHGEDKTISVVTGIDTYTGNFPTLVKENKDDVEWLSLIARI